MTCTNDSDLSLCTMSLIQTEGARMSSLDERTWLPDELWAQVRPSPARFRVPISVVVLVVAVGALVLSQIGFFHPHIDASYDSATADGSRLTVVLTLSDGAQLPVRVTGFRAAQPGARIVSARADGTFPPAPDSNKSAPDGARVAPFTVHSDRLETVTVVYLLDCAKLRAPLRVNIETRNFLGDQTSTATLDSLTSDSSIGGPLKQVCAGG
jgi:hypothetical protein